MSRQPDQAANTLELMLEAFCPSKHGGEVMAGRAIGLEILQRDTARGDPESMRLHNVDDPKDL